MKREGVAATVSLAPMATASPELVGGFGSVINWTRGSRPQGRWRVGGGLSAAGGLGGNLRVTMGRRTGRCCPKEACGRRQRLPGMRRAVGR